MVDTIAIGLEDFQVNANSINGATPLHNAAELDHLDVVKFLVQEAGADVESKDFLQNTPLDLARQGWPWGDPEGCKVVVAWLESRIPNHGSRIQG